MAISGSARITIDPSGSSAFWIKEDFNYASTADMMASTLKTRTGLNAYNQGAGNGDNGIPHISLGTGGYGGRAHFMRYTIPTQFAAYDTAGNPTGNDLCFSQCFINREMKFSRDDTKKELWFEGALRYSVDYGVNKTGLTDGGFTGTCAEAGRKQFLFWTDQGKARFDMINTSESTHWASATPSHGQNQPITSCGQSPACSGIGWSCWLGTGGDGTPDSQCSFFPVAPGRLHDGLWHIYRVYMRLASTASSSDAAMKIWIDGVLVKNVQHATGLALVDGTLLRNFDHFQLGANSNSCWTKAGAHEDWGYVYFWDSNPGWG
jgi:hypothetical protein